MKIDTTKNILLYVFDYADYEYATYFISTSMCVDLQVHQKYYHLRI